MSSQNGQFSETLAERFPPPERFGWLKVWRRESGISLALTFALALTLIAVVVAFTLRWPQKPPGIPVVELTPITLSEDEVDAFEEPAPDVDGPQGPAGEGDPGGQPWHPRFPRREPTESTPEGGPRVGDADPELLPPPGDPEAREEKAREFRVALDGVKKRIEKQRRDGGPVPSHIRNLFADRSSAAGRKRARKRDGGSPQTEAAVQLGLKWLAAHQDRSGCWLLHDFRQPECDCGHPGIQSDTAATGLALLPFLGNGQTHKKGRYRTVVQAGLKWLVSDQGPDGSFRSVQGGRMYAHALASIALCEAWALTHDKAIRESAQQAVNYILAAQHPGGGWRYTPRVSEDTSVIGWQMIALVSARAGGLLGKTDAFDRAKNYLDRAQVDKTGAQYAYTPRGGARLTMTAEGLLCRQFLGWKHSEQGLQNGVKELLRNPRHGGVNFYYWYYASQVLHHFGGKPWQLWNEQLVPVLLELQSQDGHSRGSWAPGGGHDGAGGRIYATALALCNLEIYYRHRRIYR